MKPSLLIATSRAMIDFSMRLVKSRRESEAANAVVLAELGEQIAEGAKRIERSRSKVVYLFDSVRDDPMMRNTLIRQARIQAHRKLEADTVAPSAFGSF